MADNTTINVGTGGDVIASDDIGGVKHQRIKLIYGDDGINVGDVSVANPYPVAASAVNFFFSALGENSSTAQLAASATFTGTIESTLSQPNISILLTIDQNATITVKQFIDGAGTFLASSWTYNITAGQPFSRCFEANGNYCQITLQNTGGSTTTTLNLNTAFGTLAPVTQLGNMPVALSEVNGTTLNIGQTTKSASLPVVLPSDQIVSTQDVHDSSRTTINFYANAVASGTTGTETAITLTKASGTSATATAASFVITSGKKFRISSITVASRGNATATAQVTTFNLRINTAGAVTTTSTPLVLSMQTATPATASAWDRVSIPIPDGLEYSGNGTIQFGLTANAVYTTNAPTWYVNIVGFEY